jgi:hypothetical protein
MGTDAEFLKENARIRRRQKLYAERWEGLDMSTRWIPPKNIYKRSVKHRPQTVHDWEELED